MSEIPPSGYPEPSDHTPYDSEAPTQLWQSPFRHLSQFPNRRAARRRERLEALLKGGDVTATAMLSSTTLQTATNPTGTPTETKDVSPPSPLPEPSSPESIPTGTYTSIRPVTGPRLAVFVALGVAAGGLAALQLNRALSPAHAAPAEVATATQAPAIPKPDDSPVAPPAPLAVALDDATASCAPAEEAIVGVPPLQVDVVPVRPSSKFAKSTSRSPLPTESAPADARSSAASAFANPEPSDQTACSRYPTVHIPTQLHPRINPLMTSNQVFAEQGAVKSTRRGVH